jgi:predicted ATPase/DNA-binding SARP family transcriptional activator/Tfp pilus assembly protein PilF
MHLPPSRRGPPGAVSTGEAWAALLNDHLGTAQQAVKNHGACNLLPCIANRGGTAQVEFRILGPLEVLDAQGRRLALGGPKQRALLAVLLLHAGEVVAVERLIDELWGEDPPDTAAHTLQVYVANLRKVLEPDRARRAAGTVLRTQPPGYRVDPGPDGLDLASFERLTAEGRAALAAGDPAEAAGLLRRGLELWRGPALGDVVLAASGQGERVRLEERRLAAIEDRLEADLALGRHRELVGELEALVAAHPLRERLHGQRILALYRSGRQAEALDAYRNTRQTLAEELGIDPSRPLQELERAVLAQDAGLDWVPRVPAGEPVPAGNPGPGRRPSALPVAPTPLIGQERALAEITALVRQDHARLVTLTGVGGVGKTRLALRAAAELDSAFADGVWFVPLAPVADPLLVLPTLALTLGVRETGRQPLDERLRRHLRDQQVLLLLDNFEHLLAAAPAAAGLLADCPNLTVLVTSRAALRVSGEHVYEVPPLAVPDLDVLDDAAHPLQEDGLLTNDAVALFVARARAVRPDFTLTPANAAAVAAICVRLDGLPLALELAAARVRLLSAQDLRSRLQRRLELLTGGPGDLPARQQTLRATLDSSHDLLDPVEQRLLARLAVFAGGFRLAAAEAVCSTDADLEWPVLDGLTGLVANSLLRREDQPGDSDRNADGVEPAESSRLRLLETVREYAWERLQASGEADAISGRHAAHFLALAEQAWPELWGADQERWLARLDREHDNLRAALAWAQARPDPELLAGLAGALGPYWEARGQVSEAHRWIDAALAEPASPWARAQTLMAKSRLLLLVEGDAAQAIAPLEESLTLFQDLDDDRWTVVSISHLAIALRQVGQHDRADALFDDSVQVARRHGDAWALSLALNNRGFDLLEQPADHSRARPLLEESLALRRTLGEPRGVAATLSNLGALALLDGDPDWAARLFGETLTLAQQAGLVPHTAWALTGLGLAGVYQNDKERAAPLLRQAIRLARDMGDRLTVAECLAGLAVVTADPAAAARLWGAVQRLHDDLGITPPSTRLLYKQQLAALRETLGVEALQAALADGAGAPADQLIAAAVGDDLP